MSGEGLGFVVTDFLAASGLGSAWLIARGCVGPLGWVLWLAAVHLRTSIWISWDLRWHCGVLLWEVNMTSYLLWAAQSLNQNLNSKCVVYMKLFMTLEHFKPH